MKCKIDEFPHYLNIITWFLSFNSFSVYYFFKGNESRMLEVLGHDNVLIKISKNYRKNYFDYTFLTPFRGKSHVPTSEKPSTTFTTTIIIYKSTLCNIFISLRERNSHKLFNDLWMYPKHYSYLHTTRKKLFQNSFLYKKTCLTILITLTEVIILIPYTYS